MKLLKRTLSGWPFLCLVLIPALSLRASVDKDSIPYLPILPLPVSKVIPAQPLTLEGKHPSEYHFAIADPAARRCATKQSEQRS